MSFLGISLKKKAGGSALGNFLRKTVNVASGGLLGTGKNVMQASGLPVLSSGGYVAPISGAVYQPTIEPVTLLDKIKNFLGQQSADVAEIAGNSWIKRNIGKVIVGVIGFFVAIYFVTRRK